MKGKQIIFFKKALFYIYLLLLLRNLYFLYFGKSSIITTFLLYLTTGLLLLAFLKIVKRVVFLNQTLLINLKLFIGSGLLFLFLLELFLKYALQRQATYFEKNGQFYNYSPYRTVLYRNAKKNKFCLNRNCWLINNIPFKTDVDGKPEYNYSHKYNSIGFADKEPLSVVDCPNLVVALGDSFTEGIGTHQDSTWLKEMERNYNSKVAEEQQICTLNGAIGGSDVVYEFMTFKETLLPYKPDLVLLAINYSDIVDIFIRGGMERFKQGGNIQYRSPPAWEMLCEVSIIFRHFVHDFLGYHVKYYYKNKEYIKAVKKSKNIIIDTIIAFQKIAQKHNFKLIVVFNPYLDEMSGAEQRLQDVFLRISADTSIISINLYDEFLNSPQLNGQNEKALTLYWPIDGHNNPAGYRLWGQIMADCLDEQLNIAHNEK